MKEVAFSYRGCAYALTTRRSAEAAPANAAPAATFRELSVLEFIRDRRLRGVYVDVGAGIGNHAVFLANECGPSLVVPIDGDPQTKPLLTENIRRNNHHRVPIWILPAFVSNQPSRYFNRSPLCGPFLSEARIAENSEPAAARSVDDLCRGLPRIDLIHINTDNHEFEVLQSALETLRAHRPDVCVETDFHSIVPVSELLARAGYILVRDFSKRHWYFLHAGWFFSRLDRWILRRPESIHAWLHPRLCRGIEALRSFAGRRRAVPVPNQPSAGAEPV
jgi:FkbM family methyltransferase